MATKMNIALALVALLAATLPGSIAQTTHVVGDSLGWMIPPGGASAYTTWANSKTFAVGDILLFNFTTGTHAVDEVTRSAYDACTTTSPISTSSTGPASITLTTAGEHFFLCPFTGHCAAGQKLGITVSAATPTTPAPVPEPIPAPATPVPEPTPAPATPVPEPTPAPIPVPAPAPSVPVPAPSPVPTGSPAPSPATRIPRTYVVGDKLGWAVPTNDAAAYRKWAAGKNFTVGDILLFNYTTGHTVTTVFSKAAYDSCNASAPATTFSNGPTRITLASPGEKFYICAFTGHCPGGQKLSINVTGASSPAPTPTPTPTPPSSVGTPPPSGSTSVPPPPSSAPSFAGAALPVALLSVALSFFF